jgi:hypothetical protein
LSLTVRASAASDSFEPKLLPVANLFKFSEPNFAEEVAFNKRQAAAAPHCAVCALFVAVGID